MQLIKGDAGWKAGEQETLNVCCGSLAATHNTRRFQPEFLVNKDNWQSSTHIPYLTERKSLERENWFPHGPS